MHKLSSEGGEIGRGQEKRQGPTKLEQAGKRRFDLPKTGGRRWVWGRRFKENGRGGVIFKEGKLTVLYWPKRRRERAPQGRNQKETMK